MDVQEWRANLTLTRDLVVPAERSQFFARARKGEFHALFRGIYTPTSLWSTLGSAERYELRVKAAALVGEKSDTVLSHLSAAVLWRLPLVGAWPVKVHVLDEVAAGGRNNAMFQRHTVGLPVDRVSLQGIRVTSLARTVVDVARSLSFGAAVTIADAALRRAAHPVRGVPDTLVTRQRLVEELRLIPSRHGSAKVRAVIDFANGLADRPGESMSRVSMHSARIPAPELQVRMVGASGAVYFVDFWWRQFNLIGEFDGEAKYRDPEFLRGRTPERALLDEKWREDDLRATGRGMSRWGWRHATSPDALRSHLIAAGVGRGAGR